MSGRIANDHVDIPQPLLDAILQERCILFIGSGVSREAGLPSARELAARIAKDCSYSAPSLSLPHVAQYHYDYHGQSRRRLLDLIKAVLTARKWTPARSHRLIARTPQFRTIVTTNWDRLLEDAIPAGRCVVRWRPEHAPPVAREQKEIIKLHGDIGDEGTMVITEDDYRSFFSRDKLDLPLFNKLQTLVMDHTFLFLGYSLQDPNFQYLYERVAETLGEFQQLSYAVQLDPDPVERKKWQQRKVFVIEATAKEFLSEIYRRVCRGVDREPEMAVPIEAVTNRPIIEYCGLPGIGKSVLLHMIAQELRRRQMSHSIAHALIDFNDPQLQSPNRVVEKLSSSIAQQLPFIAEGRRLIESVEEQLRRKSRVVLLFDTTEKAPTKAIRWIEEELLLRLLPMVGPLTVILAGRRPIQWKSGARITFFLEPLPLEGLSHADTRAQIDALLEEDFEAFQTLHDLSCGHPGCTEYLVDMWLMDPKKRGAFAYEVERSRPALVADLIRNFVEPTIMGEASRELREFAYLLAPLRRFDHEAVDHLVSADDPALEVSTKLRGIRGSMLAEELIAGLRRANLVVAGDGPFTLDTTLRCILNQHLQLNAPDRLKAVHQAMSAFYERRLEAFVPQCHPGARYDLVERLFHLSAFLEMVNESPKNLMAEVQNDLERWLNSLPRTDRGRLVALDFRSALGAETFQLSSSDRSAQLYEGCLRQLRAFLTTTHAKDSTQ